MSKRTPNLDVYMARLESWRTEGKTNQHKMAHFADRAIASLETDIRRYWPGTLPALPRPPAKDRPKWPSGFAYERGARTNVFVRDEACAAVAKALKLGEIKREPCFICGEPEAEAHHSSYATDMRVAVTWLCLAHHRQVHREARSDMP